MRARGSGESITGLQAEIENLTRKRLRVLVAPGTYFVSRGSHHNMVTTDRYEFSLFELQQHRINVAAACINANRPIPGAKDRFNGAARVAEPVARFPKASRGCDAMIVQAGV